MPITGDSIQQWKAQHRSITLTCCISIGGIFFIERFVRCMIQEENLSIQWPFSSDFRRFARDFCSK